MCLYIVFVHTLANWHFQNGNDVANFVDTDPPQWAGVVKKGCEWAGAVKKGKSSIGAGTVVQTTSKHQKRIV